MTVFEDSLKVLAEYDRLVRKNLTTEAVATIAPEDVPFIGWELEDVAQDMITDGVLVVAGYDPVYRAISRNCGTVCFVRRHHSMLRRYVPNYQRRLHCESSLSRL